jgi:hypothetical protein
MAAQGWKTFQQLTCCAKAVLGTIKWMIGLFLQDTLLMIRMAVANDLLIRL